MMYGKSNISLPGVDITSSSAQTIPGDVFAKVKFAEDQTIPVEITDMVASSIGIGAVRCEGLYKSSSDIVGTIPGVGLTATFKSANTVTFSS